MFGKPDVDCAHVLFKPCDAASSGDGHDVVALSEQPSEGKLAEGDALVHGECLELREGMSVFVEVLALPAGARGVGACRRPRTHRPT